MLSSLDALASKLSPGSGKINPSQQQQQQQQQQQNDQQQQQRLTSAIQNNTHYKQHLKTLENSSSPPPAALRLNGNHNHNHLSHLHQQHYHLHNQNNHHNSNHLHHHHHQHHHQQQQQNGLDSNGNKLCHITHNAIHPYQKQPNSPNSNNNNNSISCSNNNIKTISNNNHISSINNNNHSSMLNCNGNSIMREHTSSNNNNNNNNTLLQHTHQTQLQTAAASLQHEKLAQFNATPPTTPLSTASMSPQESLHLHHADPHDDEEQEQLELFHQEQQQQLQQQQQSSQPAAAPLSPTSTCSPTYDENDSQHDFGSCLKENAFSMSDKNSTINSLPSSPLLNGNSNNLLLLNNNNNNNLCNNNNLLSPTSLLGSQNNNNNNNNTCSANRNVVMDDDSCFQMDTDTNKSLLMGEKEPDPDNIKMFVGQVPKSMDEIQLRQMFEEYGPVHSINVLRDKATGISKGCCFVTFYTRRAALKAQDALHNVKTLNGMYHPIQMKPADSENRNERKLFVGMLNKKLNENDVRKLFEVYGAIEECTVLRDQNGQSKGCAFVTFATKHAAISAIKVTLNQNKTMEGCTSPLVVKFADTQKEKEQKKIQQIQANLWNLATNINIPLGQTATSVSTPTLMPQPPQQASPVLGADAITPASLQLLQQLQAVGLQQQLLQGLGAQTNSATDSATAAAAAAGLLPPMTVQNLAALAAMTQPSLTNAATNPGSAQLTNTAALLCLLGKSASTGTDPSSLASAYMSTAAGLPQFGSSALSTSPLASVALSTAAAAAAGKQIEGPEGCNLFIYHLPQEFTDTDLASTFLPFGSVISAKVFIDKQTNLSKCFGFVSFDNPESAQVAIKAMNGFQVGTKRLKVQLKKPKDASKPY